MYASIARAMLHLRKDYVHLRASLTSQCLIVFRIKSDSVHAYVITGCLLYYLERHGALDKRRFEKGCIRAGGNQGCIRAGGNHTTVGKGEIPPNYIC